MRGQEHQVVWLGRRFAALDYRAALGDFAPSAFTKYSISPAWEAQRPHCGGSPRKLQKPKKVMPTK